MVEIANYSTFPGKGLLSAAWVPGVTHAVHDLRSL